MHFQLTAKQHFRFEGETAQRVGDRLLSATAWDLLRTERRETAFSIPRQREDWVRKCNQQPQLRARALVVCEAAARLGVTAIRSYGVGTGCLEHFLHQMRPTLRLRLSDYSPETVTQLRDVFLEAESIDKADLLRDTLTYEGGELILLNRVDTEFTDDQLRAVFERLWAIRAPYVLVIPTAYLDLRWLSRELLRRLISAAPASRPSTFVGYVRTRGTYDRFWAQRYRVIAEERRGPTPSFILLERTSYE